MLFTVVVVFTISRWSVDFNMTSVDCTYDLRYAILLFKFIDRILNVFSRYWKLYELIFFSSECFLELFTNTFCGRLPISKLQATSSKRITCCDPPQGQANPFFYTYRSSHSGLLFLKIWPYKVTYIFKSWPSNVKMLFP